MPGDGSFRFVAGDRVKTLSPCGGPHGLVRYRAFSELAQQNVYAVRWIVEGSDRNKDLATARNDFDNGNSLRWLEADLERAIP